MVSHEGELPEECGKVHFSWLFVFPLILMDKHCCNYNDQVLPLAANNV
ncbi:hypothetical protein [Methylomusa anaerophila]|nr:hypothetical protein [Methylomusa anaerophila]